MTSLADDAGSVCAWLADISGRLRRFEHVSDEELAAFKERKETVVEQIDASFYERRKWKLP